MQQSSWWSSEGIEEANYIKSRAKKSREVATQIRDDSGKQNVVILRDEMKMKKGGELHSEVRASAGRKKRNSCRIVTICDDQEKMYTNEEEIQNIQLKSIEKLYEDTGRPQTSKNWCEPWIRTSTRDNSWKAGIRYQYCQKRACNRGRSNPYRSMKVLIAVFKENFIY